MSLNELLFECKLTTALIVDDGYDVTPTSQDLVTQGAAWEIFFADVVEDDKVLIVEAFPDYETTDGAVLRDSNEFVAAIWGLRGKLRSELSEPLFADYIQASKTDATFLAKLESALAAVGVEVVRAGRNIPEQGKTVSMIFADLFLGSAQNDSDLEATLSRLKGLLEGRESSPPLVILMSRSPRLTEKKAYFRDKAHLLGAMFRVLSKEDLANNVRFSQVLNTLASHHEDALRLASFIHSWDVGLDSARSRFLTTIRRLDLADYAQVRQLLLNFEGQPLGSYVLDVFDRMLQYEIEEDTATINAAKELNHIQPGSYPPPYIAGSPDLQHLVYQATFQNPKRLDVPGTESGAPVAFGDILAKRDGLEGPMNAAAADSNAFAVLTPACDLTRPEFRRALIVGGRFEALTAKEWTYRAGQTRTPIIVLPDGRRTWIRWDLKDIHTVSREELNAWLADGGSHQILARFRETHALELQQRLLADLGRVGLVAQMPATFPVTVDVFTLDTESKLRVVDLPILQREGGVCYTGRDKDSKPKSRLALSEAAIDELISAIAEIDEATVHPRCRDTLRRLRSGSGLGPSISTPEFDRKTFATLTRDVKDDNGNVMPEIIGLIARNLSSDTDPLKGDDQKNGAIVLIVRDVS